MTLATAIYRVGQNRDNRARRFRFPITCSSMNGGGGGDLNSKKKGEERTYICNHITAQTYTPITSINGNCLQASPSLILLKKNKNSTNSVRGKDDMITLHIPPPPLSHLHYKRRDRLPSTNQMHLFSFGGLSLSLLGSPRGAIASLLPEHIIWRTE